MAVGVFIIFIASLENLLIQVDGLWGGPAIAADFAAVVHRQKLLGASGMHCPNPTTQNIIRVIAHWYFVCGYQHF